MPFYSFFTWMVNDLTLKLLSKLKSWGLTPRGWGPLPPTHPGAGGRDPWGLAGGEPLPQYGASQRAQETAAELGCVKPPLRAASDELFMAHSRRPSAA